MLRVLMRLGLWLYCWSLVCFDGGCHGFACGMDFIGGIMLSLDLGRFSVGFYRLLV